MEIKDLLATLEYLQERASNPCYHQLEAGFRHTALRPKEIEERKTDCLKEISENLLFLIDELKKGNKD